MRAWRLLLPGKVALALLSGQGLDVKRLRILPNSKVWIGDLQRPILHFLHMKKKQILGLVSNYRK